MSALKIDCLFKSLGSCWFLVGRQGKQGLLRYNTSPYFHFTLLSFLFPICLVLSGTYIVMPPLFPLSCCCLYFFPRLPTLISFNLFLHVLFCPPFLPFSFSAPVIPTLQSLLSCQSMWGRPVPCYFFAQWFHVSCPVAHQY